MFFDKNLRTFLDPQIHTIPSDAIALTKDDVVRLLSARAAGCIIDVDDAGNVFAVEAPAGDQAALLNQVKAQLRIQRMPMLDALAGIAGRSQRAGDTAIAQEADELALQLLDITDDSALNAATTLEDMQAAGVTAYRRIAATASPALASAFKEITGA